MGRSSQQRFSASPSPPVPPRPHFYIPCLEGFTTQLRRYWNNRIALPASSRVPVFDDFAGLCAVAARAYLHLHHHAQYQAHGLASPSPVQTRLTVGAIRLPPYVLAMIRELARPMTLDSHTILLPYLPLLTSDETRGQGPAPPLGFKLPTHPQVVSLLAAALAGGNAHRLVPLVDSAAEAAESRALASPCPAFLCRGDGRALVIYAGRAVTDPEPFPNWRLVAVSVLKHLRPDCAWITGCHLRDEAWSVEGAWAEPVKFYRCDQDFPLEPEEAAEEGEGPNGDGQGQGHHHHHQLQEGQGHVGASMPPLLKHLDSSTEADCPGYAVRCFSTQGADVWAPFPTHPPLLLERGGARSVAGGAVMGAGEAGSLDASGSGSGKWWKRK